MKDYLAVRIYNIVNKYDINNNTVHSIIRNYIDFNKKLLYSGRRIDFNGLVYIEPDVYTTKHRATMGYICKYIASDLGLPYYTVLTVIREYLLGLKDSLMNGREAEIQLIIKKSEDTELSFKCFNSNCVTVYLFT